MSQRKLLYKPASPRMRISVPFQPGNNPPARVDPAPPIVRSSAVEPGAYMRPASTGIVSQSTTSTTFATPRPVIRVPITPFTTKAPAAYSPAAYSSESATTRSSQTEAIYVSSSPAPEMKDASPAPDKMPESPAPDTMPELAITEPTHELAALASYASSSPAPDSMEDPTALASNAAAARAPATPPITRSQTALLRKSARTSLPPLSDSEDSDDEPIIVDTVMDDGTSTLATARDPPPASAPSQSVDSASIDYAPTPASSPVASTVKARGRARKTDAPVLTQQQGQKKAPAPAAEKGKGKAPAASTVRTAAPAAPRAKKARATRQRGDTSEIATKTIALSYAVHRAEALEEERREGRRALANANTAIVKLTAMVESYRKSLTTFSFDDSAWTGMNNTVTYPQTYSTGFNGLATAPGMGGMGGELGVAGGSGMGPGPSGAGGLYGVAGGSNMVAGMSSMGGSNMAAGMSSMGDVQMVYGGPHNAYET